MAYLSDGAGTGSSLRRPACSIIRLTRLYRPRCEGGGRLVVDSAFLIKGGYKVPKCNRGHARTTSVCYPRRGAMHISAAPQTSESPTVDEDDVQASPSTPVVGSPWRPSALQAAAIMFGVALLWGTSPVCTRYLYLTPEPPSSAVLAAVQSTTSALTLGLILLYQKHSSKGQLRVKLEDRANVGEGSQLVEFTVQDSQPGPQAELANGQAQRTFSWSDLLQYPFPVPNQVCSIPLLSSALC
jgi:hypothetical protein